MGKGGNQGEGAAELEAPMPTFRWEEIQKHNQRTDKWLVIDRKVYNITKWSSRHPGGQRVIGHYAGEDATVRAWGLSRHPSPLKGGGRSRGAQGVRQHLQRRVELGGPSRWEGKVSTALTAPSESSSRGTAGSACRGGRILEPRRQIQAAEIRAGSTARARTLASVPSSEFSRSLGTPPNRGAGTLRLWRPQRGRWPPLGPAERSGRGARCRTPRASPTLRPDKGAGKESSSPAGARSGWNCRLRRSAMAASETPPGSSCSHAF